jgi:hypothetical protein
VKIFCFQLVGGAYYFVCIIATDRTGTSAICPSVTAFDNSVPFLGTKGSLKLPFPMWSPTALITDSGTQEFPLPEGSKYKVRCQKYIH